MKNKKEKRKWKKKAEERSAEVQCRKAEEKEGKKGRRSKKRKRERRRRKRKGKKANSDLQSAHGLLFDAIQKCYLQLLLRFAQCTGSTKGGSLIWPPASLYLE